MTVGKPNEFIKVVLQNNFKKEMFRDIDIDALISRVESICRLNSSGEPAMSSRTNLNTSFLAPSRSGSSASPPTSASVQKEQNVSMPNNSSAAIPSSIPNQAAANPSVSSFSAASFGFVFPSAQNAPKAPQISQSSSGSASSPGSSSSGAAAFNSPGAPPGSGFSAARSNASVASVSTTVHSSAEKPPPAQNLIASDALAHAGSLSPIANREVSPSIALSDGAAASHALGAQIPGGQTGFVFSNPATGTLPSGSFSPSQVTSNASTPLTASPAQPSGFSTPLAAPKESAPVVFSASAAQQSAFGPSPSSSGLSMTPQQGALGAPIAEQPVVGAPPASAFSSASALGVMGTQSSFGTPASLSSAIISSAFGAPAPAGTQQSMPSPTAFVSSGFSATASAAPNASVSAGSAASQAPNSANSALPSTSSAFAATPASQLLARRADAAPQVLPAVSAPNPSSNRPDSTPVHRSRDEEGVMREDEEDGEEEEGEEETEEDESFGFSSRSKKSR